MFQSTESLTGPPGFNSQILWAYFAHRRTSQKSHSPYLTCFILNAHSNSIALWHKLDAAFIWIRWPWQHKSTLLLLHNFSQDSPNSPQFLRSYLTQYRPKTKSVQRSLRQTHYIANLTIHWLRHSRIFERVNLMVICQAIQLAWTYWL